MSGVFFRNKDLCKFFVDHFIGDGKTLKSFCFINRFFRFHCWSETEIKMLFRNIFIYYRWKCFGSHELCKKKENEDAFFKKYFICDICGSGINTKAKHKIIEHQKYCKTSTNTLRWKRFIVRINESKYEYPCCSGDLQVKLWFYHSKQYRDIACKWDVDKINIDFHLSLKKKKKLQKYEECSKCYNYINLNVLNVDLFHKGNLMLCMSCCRRTL